MRRAKPNDLHAACREKYRRVCKGSEAPAVHRVFRTPRGFDVRFRDGQLIPLYGSYCCAWEARAEAVGILNWKLARKREG